MASGFPKEVIVAFEEMIQGWDSDNIVSRQTTVRRTPGQTQFRTAFREWVPVPMISITFNGIDQTANLDNQVTELSVPHDTDIVENVPFQLDSFELNDPSELRKKFDSAKQALSAKVNRDVANQVNIFGSQYIKKGSALDSYADIAAMEARLIEQDVPQTADKTLILNASDYSTMAGNLAERANMTGNKPIGAWERSFLGQVAGFDTFRSSFLPNLQAAGGSSNTVDGAQSFIPVPSITDSFGNPSNVDNRTMTLVLNSTTGILPGDKFTITGVNALSLINKADTGDLKTFSVVSNDSATDLTITPPIIVVDGSTLEEKEYANVTAVAADLAPIVFLNTAAVKTNLFWVNDAISLNAGSLAVDESNFGGLNVMRGRTDSGIEIIIANSGNLGTLQAQWRLTIFYGVTVRNPQFCGSLTV